MFKVSTYINRIEKIYHQQVISYDWEEVKKIIQKDVALFRRFWNRARTHQYIKADPDSKKLILWITCNLAETWHKKGNRCYICGMPFSYQDYFEKNRIHLEHFQPRSHGGSHNPYNINLVCRECNLLKSNLTDEDFREIWENPNSFFSKHNFNPLKENQLKEFAEILFPVYEGSCQYTNRHKISVQDQRKHLDALKKVYREKWYKG